MDDLVFVVQGAHAEPLTPITLSEADLKERQHLQEWVRNNPSMLGSGVMIVTFEFGKWIGGDGSFNEDRLDILGIDTSGRLVVVELKRGQAPDTTDMQAVKYAAMASRFTLQTLAQHHARYLNKVRHPGEPEVTVDGALEALRSHIGDPDRPSDVPSFERPRIILMANGFPSTVTATAVFLTGFGLEVTLLKFQTFKTPGGEIVFTVNRLFPIQEVEELRISPRLMEEAQQISHERSRRTVSIIIQADALQNGTKLRLVPDKVWEQRLSAYLTGLQGSRYARWDPSTPSKPLVWEADNKNYSATGLCKEIITAAGFEAFALQGPNWWVTPDGKTLVEIANAVLGD